MRRHLQITVVLFAWFMATGAQWDLVQIFGWARMVVNYSQTMPLLAAVKRTFDGEMCGVCHVVNDAKQQEKDAPLPGGKMDTKMIFVLQPVPDFIGPAAKAPSWPLSDSAMMDSLRGAPPTPPPRA